MSNENLPPAPVGSEGDVPRNSKGEPLWPRPPRKPLTGWVLLLPIILLIGVIWMKSGARPGDVAPIPSDNTAQAPVEHTVPRKQPRGSATGTKTASKAEIVLYLPNDQAELTRQTVSLDKLDSPIKSEPSETFEVVGKAALEHVFRQNPEYFPEGIKVESLKKEGDLVTLDLPADFATSPLWGKGDSYGLIATGSIVNTLASVAGNGKLAPIKVKFLSGGKSFELLGELDMTDPLEPNPTLVTSP